MIEGELELYFETGCEGHRFIVKEDSKSETVPKCSKCGELDTGHVRDCESGEHTWDDEGEYYPREANYQLSDGDYLEVSDETGKVLWEGELEFKPSWSLKETSNGYEEVYHYPDDYEYALSLWKIPLLDDFNTTDFVDLFKDNRRCKLKKDE